MNTLLDNDSQQLQQDDDDQETLQSHQHQQHGLPTPQLPQAPPNPQPQQDNPIAIPSQQSSSSNPLSSSSTSSSKNEQVNCLRLLLIMDNEGRSLMKKIFFYDVKDKEPNETLRDYLKDKRKISMRVYRKQFNKTMRTTIESDKSCEKFDISLWLRAMQCIWESRETHENTMVSKETHENTKELEKNMLSIKDERDILEHGKLAISRISYDEHVEKIEKLLTITVTAARKLYKFSKRDERKMISDITKGIDEKRRSPMTKEELETFMENVLLEKHNKIILSTGRTELIDLLESESEVELASPIVSRNFTAKVNAIFTELDIVDVEKDKQKFIAYTNLLKYALSRKEKDGNNMTQVLFMKGIVGSGKTTLLKQLISEWRSENESIAELDKYAIILFIKCRDKKASSLCDLVCSQMPKAYQEIESKKEMLQCILGFRTLIIFDGLDEMTSDSKKLYEEALKIQTNSNITIICTTRSERVKEFSNMVPNAMHQVHFEIKGVPEKSKESFVRKHHKVLQEKGMKSESTEQLLHHLKIVDARLSNILKLPLNLTLFSYLWSFDRKAAESISTATTLYWKIHELLLEKLLERLQITDSINKSLYIKNINVFVTALCWEALRGVRDDSVILSSIVVENLKILCESLSLPPKTVLGLFLTVNELMQYSFLHKGQQEFYASLYIRTTVNKNAGPNGIESLKKEIKDSVSHCNVPSVTCEEIVNIVSETLEDNHSDRIEDILGYLHETDLEHHLNKYQNTFVNLIGLFHLHVTESKYDLAQEVVELLSKSGVRDQETWIRVLNSVECEKNIARLICAMPEFEHKTASISDIDVFAYAALIEHMNLKEADIEVDANPIDVIRFDRLLSGLIERRCPVDKLDLQYLFQHPKLEPAMTPLVELITQLVNKLLVSKYTGPISPNMEIPMTIRTLKASVANTSSYEALKLFLNQRVNLHLWICVDVTIDHSRLTHLPSHRVNSLRGLILPDVNRRSASKAAAIVCALLPFNNRGVLDIFFPRCKLDDQGMRILKGKLKSMKMYYCLHFPSSCRTSVSTQGQDKVSDGNYCSGIYWGERDIDNWS